MDTVNRLYNECKDLDEFLILHGEISLKNYADANLRKNLLLASASYFEKEISELVIEFTKIISSGDDRLITFVKKKAISRQYHTLFDWKASNCNAFLGLFGEKFKKEFSDRIVQDVELDKAVKAFLEIGLERNRMVHQDFGQYSLEKTTEEIMALHTKAIIFISAIKEVLIES